MANRWQPVRGLVRVRGSTLQTHLSTPSGICTASWWESARRLYQASMVKRRCVTGLRVHEAARRKERAGSHNGEGGPEGVSE